MRDIIRFFPCSIWNRDNPCYRVLSPRQHSRGTSRQRSGRRKQAQQWRTAKQLGKHGERVSISSGGDRGLCAG